LVDRFDLGLSYWLHSGCCAHLLSDRRHFTERWLWLWHLWNRLPLVDRFDLGLSYWLHSGCCAHLSDRRHFTERWRWRDTRR
jgi:hypothetical protein